MPEKKRYLMQRKSVWKPSLWRAFREFDDPELALRSARYHERFGFFHYRVIDRYQSVTKRVLLLE